MLIQDLSRGRGFTVLAINAVLLLGMAGCGDSGETSEKVPSNAATAPSGDEPKGPEGSLSSTSFGSVEQGMELNETIDIWGQPDQRKRFPGCELNPNARESQVLTWNVPDGDVMASFDSETERLDSFRTSSKQFPTKSGVRVGDSFALLRDSEGTSLMPLNLGATSSSRDGYWYTGDPVRAEQLFTIAGGKVTMISGGYLPSCE